MTMAKAHETKWGFIGSKYQKLGIDSFKKSTPQQYQSNAITT